MRLAVLLLVACSASGPDAPDAHAGDDGAPDAGRGDDGAPDAGRGDGGLTDGGVAPAVVVDRLLLDNAGGTERLNLELAPKGRWATLNEREGRAGPVRPVLFRVEANGALTRRCAFDVALSIRGSMQLGEAAGETFAVGLRQDTRSFVVLTPRDEGPCDAMLAEVPVRLPAELTPQLNNPYPVRGHDGARLVAFHRHDEDADRESVYLQDLDAEAVATLVWEASRPRGRSFGTFISVARWPEGEARFVAGRWVDGVAQAYETTLEAGMLRSRVLTRGAANLPDVFPFRAGGRGYLLTNDGGGPDGLLLAEADEGGAYTERATVAYDAGQSAVEGRASSALSFEVFRWDGDLYATYQVADRDDRGPGCRGVNCTWNELWMAAFTENAAGTLAGVRATCRISAAPTDPAFRAKVDPEPVVTAAGLRVFYQRSDLTRPPGQPGNQLAVLEIADRAAFDAACAAGRAFPAP